jgi:hypothetical protein
MKLVGIESDGFRTFKTYRHLGDDGKDKITTTWSEDVSKVFDSVKRITEGERSRSDMKLKAQLPATLIDEVSKINAGLWGVSTREAFSELIQCKTDRAKKAMKTLTEGSDYSKLQAKSYRR